MPGHLSVPIRWNGGKLNLEFRVNGKEIAIYQDGKLLGRSSLGKEFKVNLARLKTRWRMGIFGPFSGTTSSVNALIKKER